MGGCFSSSETIQLRNCTVEKLKCIGQGAYSFVYLVQNGNRRFAIKEMLCQTDELYDQARNELNILKQFPHKNIIQLFDFQIVTQKDTDIKIVYLLLEYYPDGNLEDWLAKNLNREEAELLRIFRGVCEGIRHLHRHDPPLAHRDIKPQNILISSTLNPVLIDLGSVCPARISFSSHKEAQSFQEYCDTTCTPLYRAPELFEVEVDVQIDERSDIWSLGGLLYFMAFQTSPFEKVYATGGSLKLAAMSGVTEYPPSASKFSPEFMQLMKDMLQPTSQNRPNIDMVIQRVESLL